MKKFLMMASVLVLVAFLAIPVFAWGPHGGMMGRGGYFGYNQDNPMGYYYQDRERQYDQQRPSQRDYYYDYDRRSDSRPYGLDNYYGPGRGMYNGGRGRGPCRY